MQTYELDAWLGDARADLTDEQYERLVTEVEVIEERYPGEGGQADRDAAMSATVQYLLGEVSVAEAGSALTRARVAEAEAYAAAQQVARLAVLDGAPKSAAAVDAAIDRKSLYRALGAGY